MWPDSSLHMVDKKHDAQARTCFHPPGPLLPKGPLTPPKEALPAETQTPEAGRYLTFKSVHVPHSSAMLSTLLMAFSVSIELCAITTSNEDIVST